MNTVTRDNRGSAAVVWTVAVTNFSMPFMFAGVGVALPAIGRELAMSGAAHWSLSYALLIFLMWWIMMIAMMTPSAAPMLALYTALKRMGPEADHAVLFSGLFLAGYLVLFVLIMVILDRLIAEL